MRSKHGQKQTGRRLWREWGLLAACGVLFSFAGGAVSAEPRGAGPQESSRIARAARVEQAPKLDGTLDDPLWQQAEPISEFHQREPLEGQPATERTEVRILYTRHEVYFGINCEDSSTAGIVARE